MAGNILRSGGHVTVVPVHPFFGSHLYLLKSSWIGLSSEMHLHDYRHLYKHTFIWSKEAVAFFLSCVGSLHSFFFFACLLVCLFWTECSLDTLTRRHSDTETLPPYPPNIKLLLKTCFSLFDPKAFCMGCSFLYELISTSKQFLVKMAGFWKKIELQLIGDSGSTDAQARRWQAKANFFRKEELEAEI